MTISTIKSSDMINEFNNTLTNQFSEINNHTVLLQRAIGYVRNLSSTCSKSNIANQNLYDSISALQTQVVEEFNSHKDVILKKEVDIIAPKRKIYNDIITSELDWDKLSGPKMCSFSLAQQGYCYQTWLSHHNIYFSPFAAKNTIRKYKLYATYNYKNVYYPNFYFGNEFNVNYTTNNITNVIVTDCIPIIKYNTLVEIDIKKATKVLKELQKINCGLGTQFLNKIRDCNGTSVLKDMIKDLEIIK